MNENEVKYKLGKGKLILFLFFSSSPFQDPYDPPSSLILEVLSSTYIKAKCGAIHQNRNGHIISYTAYYAKVDTDGSTIIGDWQSATSHNAHVHLVGLEFWTYYAVKVAGATVIGLGPNTTYQIARTHEDCKLILFLLFNFNEIYINGKNRANKMMDFLFNI